MSDQNSVLKATEGLLEKADKFHTLNKWQKANFRKSLTVALKEVQDPEIKVILEDLQAEYGSPDAPAAKKATAEELGQEYREKYAGYSMEERKEFKRKVTRLLNESKENGNEKAAEKMVALQDEMVVTELRLRRQRVLALAKGRKGKGQ